MANPCSITAVFLDRDGVINEKAPEGRYITSWAEFRFLPGALNAIRELTEAGLTLVVVTNQRGIARGHMSDQDLDYIHRRMFADVDRAGGRIAAVYHCPHEEGICDCRKPRTGLFEQAARSVPGVVLSRSAVVGDRAHDMEAAERIGALRVLVGGAGEPMPPVDYIAPDLRAAARWLVGYRRCASARSSSS